MVNSNYTPLPLATCSIILNDMELISAYRQLAPIERVFVDAYITDVQADANNAGRRVIDFIREYGGKARASGKYYADKFMSKPMVQAAINERVMQVTEAADITAYKVVREVALVAQSSIVEYYEIDPQTGYMSLALHKCTPEQLRAIKSIKIRETVHGRTEEIELHPKMQALDMLFKYMGLYNEDNNQRFGAVIDGKPGAQSAQRGIPANASTSDAADMYQRTLRGG